MAFDMSNDRELSCNSLTHETDFFKLALSIKPLNASTVKTLSELPRIADANNFDDTYLSLIEIRDLLESRRERAAGSTHSFSNVEDMLAWLHSD